MSARHAWPWLASEPLILASQSATRAGLLSAAGVPVAKVRPQVDERAVDAPLRAAGLVAADRALLLARAKAVSVSKAQPGRLVLGADQTLDAPGHPGVKAADRRAAQAHLRTLSGRVHKLWSAACVVRDGAILFECVDAASLAMRPLSDETIHAYLVHVGDDVLDSVGAYRIEEIGVNLFDAVDGAHPVILGLPLMPILAFLRRAGALAT